MHTLLSALLQPSEGVEEAVKEGSDKERERERGVKVRWEGACERKRRQPKERKGEGGMEGAMIFSPPGCYRSSSWLCYSFVRSDPCAQETTSLPWPALSHGAGDESAPTKSIWDGSVHFCLEGGTHQAFPGKQQPAAWTGLRDSLPLRFVCGRETERERERTRECEWMWVLQRLGVCVYVHTLASWRRQAPLFPTQQGKGNSGFGLFI